MDTRTSHKITYLYLLMALMIFCLHGVVIERFSCPEWVVMLNRGIRVLCNTSVSTFFFLSAVLLYRNTDRNYRDLIISKVKSLIIPYFAWSMILTIVKIIKGEYVLSNATSVLYDLVLSENNSVLWFVRVLFIYILLFPVICRLIKHRWLCFASIIAIFILNIAIGPTVGYSTARYWLPVYLLGAYLGKNFWEVLSAKIFQQNWKYYCICVIMIGLIVFGTVSGIGLYVCRMIFPILFWIVADIFLITYKPKEWMRQSFFFYCSQLLVTSISSKIYIRICGTNYISAVLAHIFIPLIMLFILAVLFVALKKFAPRMTSILTGSRS